MISLEQVVPQHKPATKRRRRERKEGISKSKRRRHANKDSAAALAAVDRARRSAALGGARGMFGAGRESRSVSISADTTFADGEHEYMSKVPAAARRAQQTADAFAHRRRRERERQLSSTRHDAHARAHAHDTMDKGDESTPEDQMQRQLCSDTEMRSLQPSPRLADPSNAVFSSCDEGDGIAGDVSDPETRERDMVCRRRHAKQFFELSSLPLPVCGNEPSAAVPASSSSRRREESKPTRLRGRRGDSETMYTANGEAERLSALVPGGLTSGSESEAVSRGRKSGANATSPFRSPFPLKHRSGGGVLRFEMAHELVRGAATAQDSSHSDSSSDSDRADAHHPLCKQSSSRSSRVASRHARRARHVAAAKACPQRSSSYLASDSNADSGWASASGSCGIDSLCRPYQSM